MDILEWIRRRFDEKMTEIKRGLRQLNEGLDDLDKGITTLSLELQNEQSCLYGFLLNAARSSIGERRGLLDSSQRREELSEGLTLEEVVSLKRIIMLAAVPVLEEPSYQGVSCELPNIELIGIVQSLLDSWDSLLWELEGRLSSGDGLSSIEQEAVERLLQVV